MECNAAGCCPGRSASIVGLHQKPMQTALNRTVDIPRRIVFLFGYAFLKSDGRARGARDKQGHGLPGRYQSLLVRVSHANSRKAYSRAGAATRCGSGRTQPETTQGRRCVHDVLAGPGRHRASGARILNICMRRTPQSLSAALLACGLEHARPRRRSIFGHIVSTLSGTCHCIPRRSQLTDSGPDRAGEAPVQLALLSPDSIIF